MGTTRRRVVTERDIARAVAEGATVVDARDAAVTPSARDAARRHGITLSTVAGSTGSAGAATAQPPAPQSSGTPPDATSRPRRVVVGADHGGVSAKDAIVSALRAEGYAVEDVGTFGGDPVDYPDYAVAVASSVADGRADVGIMIDGAGIGSCMAANKVRGVRAAMCYDVTTAANAREHNNANVLTLGGTLLGPRLILEIVSTFMRTPFGGGRHAKRVDKIDALDARASRG